MENNEEEIPEIQNKVINGVEISNLDYAKIAMVCDYLILDHFHDISSFLRLEKCFGPFFAKENADFLPNVFKEICGEKKKYITFARLILAYCKWKSKSSTNENFNKFMDLVFGDMIKTQDEVIGKLVEGGRIFSTRNTRGRKVISRFSVLTDPTKNKIEGFHIQYDDFFDSVLSPKKKRDDITLEMNFEPNGKNIRDRDGISHIAGKYSTTKGIIKLLIFKCRSGKTFYIGDEKEEEGEQFEFFLFGTSSCQLKTIRVELVNEQLIYLEPKFQPSIRVNQKLIPFESLDEKYIDENIINAPLIFEENEIQSMSEEQLKEANMLLIPCISDDAFIDKKALEEPLCGKDFNEIYKTFLVSQSEVLDKEKEELKKKVYEKTIMRKHLLKVYFNKFKVKENISVLKTQKPAEPRVNMDKFLCKVKAYKKKVNKKIEQKKEELEKKEEEEIWDDGEDWPDDKSETNEIKEEDIPKESEPPKEEQTKETKEEEIKINIENEANKPEENGNNEQENKIEIEPPKTEDDKIVIEPPKLDENKIEIEPPKVEINKVENKIEINVDGGKSDELKVEAPGEEKLLIEVTNEKDKLEPQDEKILLKGNKPRKLLKKSLNKLKEQQEEPKNEEIKKEEPKKEEVKPKESNIEENKIEQPKVEEIKKEEPKKEEIKKEEPKKEEIKKEEPKKEEIKKEEAKIEEKKKDTKKTEEINNNKINVEKKEENIKEEDKKITNKKVKEESVKKENAKQEPLKKKKSSFCISF
jgi:hypothetical protein